MIRQKKACLNAAKYTACPDVTHVDDTGRRQKPSCRNGRFKKSENMAAALDIRQEILAVCARLSLRIGVDDLMTLVLRFLNANCSKSSLNQCLKHYGVSRLPALTKPWSPRMIKDSGSWFYYSRFIFPARFYSKEPLFFDLMVDNVCRMVWIQAAAPPHGSALAFVKNAIAHFPIKVIGIIAEKPVALLDSGFGFSGDTYRHLHTLKQFCAIQDINCDVVCSTPSTTLKALEDSSRKVVALSHDIDGRINGLNGTTRTQAVFSRISAGLDIYHDTPLKGLKNQSPSQAMVACYQDFPTCFARKPKQSYETFTIGGKAGE